jgi:hypothetical protein
MKIENAQQNLNSILNETKLSINDFNYITSLFYDGLLDFYGEYQINLRILIQNLMLDLVKIFYEYFNLDKEITLDDFCLEKNLLNFNLINTSSMNSVVNGLIISIDSIKLFNIGLTKMRDFLIDFLSKFDSIDYDCVRQLTRIETCQICDQMFDSNNHIGSCVDICVESYLKCLKLDILQFDLETKSYINLMKSLASDLQTPKMNIQFSLSEFNQVVKEQMNNFILRKHFFVTELKQKCGVMPKKYSNKNNYRNKLKKLHPKLNQKAIKREFVPSFEKFMDNLIKYYIKLKDVWIELIPDLCYSVSVKETCWTGNNLTK